ncbi:hypothetical protein C8R45DRAFT_1073268 [Mycena sanguinolenta]|nr:hypothetical protein C8R45DRAFT_1073268 [Mycena sanguinolenta]
MSGSQWGLHHPPRPRKAPIISIFGATGSQGSTVPEEEFIQKDLDGWNGAACIVFEMKFGWSQPDTKWSCIRTP